MALPQEIKPLNSELMDTLVQAGKMDWTPQPFDPERSFVKVLWTGSESGSWAVLLKWKKGFVAPPHKHLSASHTFILSGKLKVREKKLLSQQYQNYSGHPGGQRIETLKSLSTRKGYGAAIRLAVQRMLPNNTMRVGRLKRLHISE